MAIRSIEIMCIPCPKCEPLMKMISEIITNIEQQNKIKIAYSFKYTPHLQDLSKYSVNASQTPAVIINGKVELAGAIEPNVLKMKLESIHRST